MVWNFKAAASEKLKRQIFTVLEYILENYEISRLREYKLTGLQLFTNFASGSRLQISSFWSWNRKQHFRTT